MLDHLVHKLTKWSIFTVEIIKIKNENYGKMVRCEIF